MLRIAPYALDLCWSVIRSAALCVTVLNSHNTVWFFLLLTFGVLCHATPRHATPLVVVTAQLSPDVFKTTIETINSFFEDAERHTQALYWRNFANCLLGYVPVRLQWCVPVRLQWCAPRSSLGLPSFLSPYISFSLVATHVHPPSCHVPS